MPTQRLILGISGADGFQYGHKALQLLQNAADIETHLVISKGAEHTCRHETAYRIEDIAVLADVVHPVRNLGAAIASGSFETAGMLVAPCSMRSLAAIAHGLGDNLLTRAADVTLKERRRLVLMTRESPLSLIHLRNMAAATEAGAIICPPIPALYQRPASIDEMVDHSVARALDLLGLPQGLAGEWEGF